LLNKEQANVVQLDIPELESVDTFTQNMMQLIYYQNGLEHGKQQFFKVI